MRPALLDTLIELHGQDVILQVLIHIESGEYYKAMSLIRYPGQNIYSVAEVIQRLAKSQFNKDIMPYLEKYKK